MPPRTIEAAIRTALDFERKVLGVYEDAAAASSGEAPRRVFEALAAEEAGHVAYLEARLAEWHKAGRVSAEPVPQTLPGEAAIAATVARLGQQVSPNARDEALSAELDSLKKALAAERETSAFYEQMVGELPAEGKALFAPFVDIERAHQALVQAEIDAVTGMGFWFDTTEFRLEGG